jgi:hypothetical protein
MVLGEMMSSGKILMCPSNDGALEKLWPPEVLPWAKPAVIRATK